MKTPRGERGAKGLLLQVFLGLFLRAPLAFVEEMHEMSVCGKAVVADMRDKIGCLAARIENGRPVVARRRPVSSTAGLQRCPIEKHWLQALFALEAVQWSYARCFSFGHVVLLIRPWLGS